MMTVAWWHDWMMMLWCHDPKTWWYGGVIARICDDIVIRSCDDMTIWECDVMMKAVQVPVRVCFSVCVVCCFCCLRVVCRLCFVFCLVLVSLFLRLCSCVCLSVCSLVAFCVSYHLLLAALTHCTLQLIEVKSYQKAYFVLFVPLGNLGERSHCPNRTTW